MDFYNIDLFYESTAERHFVNIEEMSKESKSFRDLIHIAFEFRICIERLCFEYLVLITLYERKLTKKEINLYHPDKIIKTILAEQPNFIKIIEFSIAVVKHLKIRKNIIVPDLGLLKELYGKLNDYLHLQTEQLNDKKKIQLISLLTDSFPKIREMILNRGYVSEPTDHAKVILEAYINNEIDKASMEKRVEISTLPLQMYDQDKL